MLQFAMIDIVCSYVIETRILLSAGIGKLTDDGCNRAIKCFVGSRRWRFPSQGGYYLQVTTTLNARLAGSRKPGVVDPAGICH